MAGEEYKDCLRLKDAERSRLLEALKDTAALTFPRFLSHGLC